MRRSTPEPFFMIVLRALDALKARELSFRAFGLLAFLCGEADFRTGKVTMSLRAMSDTVGWDGTTDWLRKNLRLLRDGGWIAYESRPGQQKPYVITLTGAKPASTSAPASDPGAGARAELTSERVGRLGGSDPSGERARASSGLQTNPSPPERQRDIDDEEYDAGFLEAIGTVGRLSGHQRVQALEVWRENPMFVRKCLREAKRGRVPAALFMSLVKDFKGTGAGAIADEWVVQTCKRDPTDPEHDRTVVLGPMPLAEAQVLAADDPDAVLRRFEGTS